MKNGPEAMIPQVQPSCLFVCFLLLNILLASHLGQCLHVTRIIIFQFKALIINYNSSDLVMSKLYFTLEISPSSFLHFHNVWTEE